MRKHPVQSTDKKKRLVPHEQSSNAEHGKERLAVYEVASSAECRDDSPFDLSPK